MSYEAYSNMSHLVAQAHGLYLRLRDRLSTEENSVDVIHHAYERYRRRVVQLGAQRLQPSR